MANEPRLGSMRSAGPARPLAALIGIAPPFLLALLFLIIATHDLALPGLYGDEAIQITPALQVVEQRSDQLFNGLPRTQVPIGERRFPLMIVRYMGALKPLLFLPIAAAAGSSIYTVRLFTLLLAALVVLATYEFTARLFSRRAAAIATLLLALDQSFILRTRVDWGPNAVALVCKMAALVALLRWWESSRRVWLGLGGFVLGLGLYNRPILPGCSPPSPSPRRRSAGPSCGGPGRGAIW